MATYMELGLGAVRPGGGLAAGAHKLRILEAKARWSVFQALGSQGVGGQLTEVRASPSECLVWAWGQ